MKKDFREFAIWWVLILGMLFIGGSYFYFVWYNTDWYNDFSISSLISYFFILAFSLILYWFLQKIKSGELVPAEKIKEKVELATKELQEELESMKIQMVDAEDRLKKEKDRNLKYFLELLDKVKRSEYNVEEAKKRRNNK